MGTISTPSVLTRVGWNISRPFVSKLIGAAVLLVASISPSYATLDFYDSFNYTNANVQLAAAASPNWVSYLSGVHPTNTLGSLIYPGLATAWGDNSVVFNGTSGAGVAAHSLSKTYNITNTTTLYYSLTFKVTSITTGDWGGSANWINGAYLLGFNQKATNGATLAPADAAAPLLIRTGNPNNTDGTANDFQGYQLGVGVTATSATRTFDPNHIYYIGNTLFIVVSYTFNPGANDDVARLYINPVPGSLEANNTPVVITSAGALDVANSQIQSFFLRNNSVEPSSTQIDDLRVGTTWADVTPASAPELRFESVSPSVVLSWPTSGVGFVLEGNSTLSAGSWTPESGSLAFVDSRFYHTNSSQSGTRFFRLRR